MSVTIRLSRIGKRNAPAYKIVVANTKDKRNGRSLDILGHYNPSHTPELFDYDKEKYEDWVSKGAIVSDAVKKLIAGEYEYKPYDPKQENSNPQENTTPVPKEKEAPEEPEEVTVEPQAEETSEESN